MRHCPCANKQKRRHFHAKTTSAKLYYYIGVRSRDLFIDEAHTVLDIFPACCLVHFAAFFSKVFENLVIKWLLEYIGDQIDTKQFGGQRGNSITHYLIEFINFILYNQDMTNPHAVLTLLVDYAKAYNRSDHHTIAKLSPSPSPIPS